MAYLVAKDLLKLNSAIKPYLISLKVILYSEPLNTWEGLICQFINGIVIDWQIIQFSCKGTSLDSRALNPSDILPRQNWVGNVTYMLSALN